MQNRLKGLKLLILDVDGVLTDGSVIYNDIPATHHHAARSNHPSGVNAALCDGSVRFFSNSIDLVTWRALSTAKGREVTYVGGF